MNNLAEFLVGITEKSLDRIEEHDWVALRPLEDREAIQLWGIDKAWVELDSLRSEVESLLTPNRRSAIRSRVDLTDLELEILSRLLLTRDVFHATQNAFWSPVKYEYRGYEQLTVDRETLFLMGRGSNRGGPRVLAPHSLEPMGVASDEEMKALARLFGD